MTALTDADVDVAAGAAEDQARRVYLVAAARLAEKVPRSRFAFLRDYQLDPATLGADSWCGDPTSPLHRLAVATGFDLPELVDLFTLALVDEDARFGAVFDDLTGHPRPTTGLLHAWWPGSRPTLRRMREVGLVVGVPGAVSTADECLRVPALVWDALRGDAPGRGGALRHRPASRALPVDDLILPDDLAGHVGRIPGALASGSVDAVVLRGPLASGRRTVAAAVAAAAGFGVLEVGLEPGDERWASVGVLATLLGDAPILVVEPDPGERRSLPVLAGSTTPVLVVTGSRGAVTGPDLRRSVTVDLGVPGPVERARHWAAATGSAAGVRALAERYRMTGGNIRQVAESARAATMLAGRGDAIDAIDAGDVAVAVRELQRHHFDTIATRVPTPDSWSALAVAPEAMRDLALAELRCRHRESLAASSGPGGGEGGCGVRLLFRGPSGTGKTLAARTLAGVLGLDLYAVDLAAVVDKYLGETEKNLDRLFCRAEETGAALLLDEGDALLTRRTSVESSNDRYANLETNFLLQRLESFEGILVVTTNAATRIDGAFERRMDVVVDFPQPDEAERWWLWRLHLPSEHDVVQEVVDDLAVQCQMTGAEIRNAVLHARLLAVEDGVSLHGDHLVAAAHRELERSGRTCPLPCGGRRG